VKLLSLRPAASASLETTMAHLLKQRSITLDTSQQKALSALQHFYQEWLNHRFSTKWLQWLNKKTISNGIYLWGGVGRGKSLLMDTFYDAINTPHKARWHFHAFMRHIHHLLAQHKKEADPLVYVAKLMAKQTHLLCFDEFHVSDIADAMILGRLLEHLFLHGTCIVLTSNYAPEELYPNGLQRQSFLPTIDLLNKRLQRVHVEGSMDYRHRTLTSHSLYYAPQDAQTEAALQSLFQELNNGSSISTENLIINDRPITVRATGKHILWCDFNALCGTSRSQHDYLELADQFDTLIVSHIPTLQHTQSPEAIRFKWLIDILYDHKIKLILSAEIAIEALYGHPEALSQSGQGASEAARTLSRLTEMQSDQYLHEAKRPVLDPHAEPHSQKDNIAHSELNKSAIDLVSI
jgi:cell division protein ZapE